MTVTNAYSLGVRARAQIEMNKRSNPTAATISGAPTPTGGAFAGYNSTTQDRGSFMAARSPKPFTGGSKAVERCGAMIVVGLLIGGMAVVL